MGEEVSESCRAMEKLKYWTEFDPTDHKFFKVLVPDFRIQLRIPKKFMRNFREELPETICLRGPSGSTWRVRLRRTTGEDVVLCGGWDEFVNDHGLEERDFLMFQYAGNSTFSVEIFDFASCCEREGAYFVNKHSRGCSNDVCSLQKKVGEVAEEIRCLELIGDGEDESSKDVNKGRRGKRVGKAVGRKENGGGASENDGECSVAALHLRSVSSRRKTEKNVGEEAEKIVIFLKCIDGEDDSGKNVEKRGRRKKAAECSVSSRLRSASTRRKLKK